MSLTLILKSIGRLICVFAMVFMVQKSSATVYYVSSSTGDDSNSGLSPADPFETVDHINGLTLLPGDEIRFFCGDIWRGQQ